MSRTLPEMLQRLDTTGNAATVQGTDMSVLGRYRDVLKWQQEQIQLQLPQQQLQLQQRCCNGLSMLSLAVQAQNFRGLINGNILGLNALQISDKPNLSAENGWPGFGFISTVTTIDPDHSARCDNGSPGYGEKPAISRTTSTPQTMAAAADEVVATATANAKCRQSTTSEMLRATDGKEGFKKRKAEMMLPPKVDAKEDNRDKKIKACTKEEEAKITYQQQNSNKNSNSSNNGNKDNKNNGEGSGWTSKENSKVFRDQKPDYIHVRALHRQATDSQSLAERVRREKIGERMKYLQDLVPGCNKITGKARMLDEIINYVQSLKRQVEFLSMKLAAINPRLDFNIDDLTVQEVFLASSAANFPSMAISKDIATHSYLPYNLIQQMDQQFQNSLPWEADLQSIFTTEFQQGRPTFPSQT